MRRRIAGLAALSLAVAALVTTLGALSAAAAPQKKSYIVVMKADPLVRSMSAKSLGTPTAKSRKGDLRRVQDKVLAAAGLPASAKSTSYTNALNGFAVRATDAQVDSLSKRPEVAAVLVDELRQPTAHDTSRSIAVDRGGPGNRLYDFLGLDGRSESWRSGLTGAGVTVGVIDTGIWPEHPSFADDGSYPVHAPLDTSVGSACAFGNTAHNPGDAAFTCNNKLVGARVFLDTYRANSGLTAEEFDSARDNEGHGTHTASTAAGNANVQAQILGVDKGMTSGIAPRAQVIAYKALGEGGGYTSDLVAAIDQAVADGVDVINYSIGGGAATVAADTLAFLFAADAGVYSAVSAGNSGPGAKTIGGPADVPWVTSVGANTQPTFYQGTIEAGGKRYLGASVTKGVGPAKFVDAAAAGSELCLEGQLNPAKVAGAIVLCKRGGNGRVAKSAEVLRAGGVGMVLFNAVDVDTLFSDTFFVPTVMIDFTPGTQLKAWIAGTPNPVGRLVSGGFGTSPFYSPTMAYFSSRGENPTAGDIIKPDITAPGVQIMAGNTPKPSGNSQPSGELFQAIAGTSMSSPVVAGSYALLKQAHPTWSPAAAKSALMTTANTAVRDNDRVSAAGPFAMGSGMVDLGEPRSRGSAYQPGLVYDAGFTDYLGFLCAEGPSVFGNPAATCASLAASGIPTRAADLNLSSIGVEAVAGSTTVTRTVTSVADRRTSFEAKVQAPAGYRVTVTPSRITLAPGASATFTVTITNTGSAPAGQWRTGALTWRGDGYEVRSPIAVKGTTLSAPTSVSGTGTSGSASLALQFGFAGPYTATAEGLLAATHTPGTIAQDPDTTYPSPDDGAGVVSVPFTLSGVGVAKWALNMPDPTDLDIYLFGPGGNLVGASTNGGTKESILLNSPADGTYTMVIHGWAVGATPLQFDLRSWLVPAEDGAGSLSISSGASTTATIGGSHTVGIAWTGLTAGEEYFGSVTHRNGTAVVGRTVVSVTG
ncbi:MAG TPA: S8 family peptidase [Dermatophilaceae bacterium]|nr:S8 family peptidase [Dermatophilaceae bacterium]